MPELKAADRHGGGGVYPKDLGEHATSYAFGGAVAGIFVGCIAVAFAGEKQKTT